MSRAATGTAESEITASTIIPTIKRTPTGARTVRDIGNAGCAIGKLPIGEGGIIGSTYLPLDEWCDEAAVAYRVIDQDWRRRARSSGGFDGWPLCVEWHHTGGSSNAWDDGRYETYTADAKPISNIKLDRDGSAVILAGGRTNTAGSGSSMRFSRGTVPDGQMNNYGIGLELCNRGTGKPFPQVQIDSAFAFSNVANRRCGNRPDDVCTHQCWAPTRKFDPATAAAVQGQWRPRSCTSSGTWNLDDLRAECLRRAEGDDDMPSAQEVADAVWNTYIASQVAEQEGMSFPASVYLTGTHQRVFNIPADVWNALVESKAPEQAGMSFPTGVYLTATHAQVFDLPAQLADIANRLADIEARLD